MTSKQRNDLCIEWEHTSKTTRQQLLDEYLKQQTVDNTFEGWEDFLAIRLGMSQFWKSVGLA